MQISLGILKIITKIVNPNSNREDIQSGHWDGIRHRKMNHANNENHNQKKIRMLREKETYKYLGLLDADTIKQIEMKEKNKKEYHSRTKKLPETILYNRPIFEVDQRTRKFMTMYKKRRRLTICQEKKG